MIEVIKELFKTLDRTLNGEKLSKPEVKQPLDVHADYSKFIDVSSLIDVDRALCRKPIPADEYHKHLRYLDLSHDSKQDRIYNMLNISRLLEHMQLDEPTTRTLIENSRRAKASIQGLLSLAITLCMVHEKFDLNNLKGSDSLEAGCSIPVNQRYSFNMPNSELQMFVGMLSWMQRIEADKPLWQMACEATKTLRELKNANVGLEYLVRVDSGLPNEDDFVVLNSTLGNVSLNENELRHIAIEDFRFSKTNSHTFNRSFEKFDIVIISHAYTFANRFNFNISYAFPHFSSRFGRNFAKNLYNLIVFMSKVDSNQSTLADVLHLLKRYT